MNCKGCGRNTSWANSNLFPSIRFVRSDKTTEIISRANRCPGEVSNMVHRGYSCEKSALESFRVLKNGGCNFYLLISVNKVDSEGLALVGAESDA
jgi:hypothetical protein